MPKPVVVIVGRPNVGKSTLFNRIVGKKAAIVEDTPGVTRDRNYMNAVWDDKVFTIVDTGGFYPRHDDNIFTQIKEQALFAIDEADVIVHLLDGKDGANPYDADMVDILRTSGKRVLWAVNKVDTETREDRTYEFYSLGIEELFPVSAATGYNYDDFMDLLTGSFVELALEFDDYPNVAIVGRPNVGKSTLVNSLIGKKRLLVSPVAGTTRDSIDTPCSYYRRKYLLIDTAGIRRKDRRGYSIERFAMVRSLRAIDRCDVAIILIDATEGITTEDQKIAGLVNESLKSAIFALNKWDLVEGDHDKVLKKIEAQIARKLWFFQHAPVITTSGLEKKRITRFFPVIDELMKERKKRIPTSALNKFAETINIPPYKHKKVRIYYMTQYRTSPPGFALFTNRPEGIRPSHLRNIEARLREEYSFKGTPLLMKVRQRSGERSGQRSARKRK
ncbi:ribosome biogenesis GTPase Der [Nitrospirota bacterium]